MRKRTALLILAGVFATALAFQNCTKVALEQPMVEDEINELGGTISLCLDGAFAKDTVETAAVVNLNLVNRGGTVARDSDSDGLSDDEELAFGFDPMKRRTNGRFLDSICLGLAGSKECDDVAVSCAGAPNALGLTDCDWKALGLDLLYAHPSQGIDSDKDGLPDLIEILRGTLPNQRDDLIDPDHDLVRNMDEIARGSDPRTADEPFASRFEVISSLTRKTTPASCSGGELWEMKVKRLPWVKAAAMTEPSDSQIASGGLTFSRPAGSNTGLIYLKLRPKTGESGNSKVLIRPLLIDTDLVNLDGSISDFKPAGEVQP